MLSHAGQHSSSGFLQQQQHVHHHEGLAGTSPVFTSAMALMGQQQLRGANSGAAGFVPAAPTSTRLGIPVPRAQQHSMGAQHGLPPASLTLGGSMGGGGSHTSLLLGGSTDDLTACLNLQQLQLGANAALGFSSATAGGAAYASSPSINGSSAPIFIPGSVAAVSEHTGRAHAELAPGLPAASLSTPLHVVGSSNNIGNNNNCSTGNGHNAMAVAVAHLKLQQLMAVEQVQQQLQDEVMRLLPLI